MRIRTVKPEFFTHAELFDAEKELGLPLRVAFIGLWSACDREGRFRWEPRRLGVSILPYDCIDFSRVLDALVTRGFAVKYRVGNDWFGCVPSFTTHQVINNRESKSKLPDVSEAEEVIPNILTRGARVPTRDVPAQAEGKEGEGNMEGEQGMESPLVPLGGNGQGESHAKNLPTSIPAIRIAHLFKRRLTTPWSEKEVRAFKKLHPLDLDELTLVEGYYEAERAKGDDGIHRRDMLTFLNNFPGEVDRARQAQNSRPATREKHANSQTGRSSVNRNEGNSNANVASQYRLD